MPITETPAEEYARRLAGRRETATRRVAWLAGWWAAVQVVTLTELCTALALRDRFDADAAVTVGLIWFVSVPVAAGALGAAVRHWPVLSTGAAAAGVAPWGVTLVETTLAAACWWLLV